MRFKAIIILFCIFLFSSFFVGCVNEQFDMYGRVTEVVYDEQQVLREIHLDNIDPKGNYDKVVTIISDATRFLGFDKNLDLFQGQILGLVFKDGPITKIYPARIEAEIVNAMKDRYFALGDYENQDNGIFFQLELVNNYLETKELQFGSGQQYEIVVTNQAGEEVYRYSDGKAFTMALVYKSIQPGRSLNWEYSWDMTDKVGNKVEPGVYQANVHILAGPTGKDPIIAEGELTTSFELVIESSGILEPEVAQKLIGDIGDQVMQAIADKDANRLAEFVHPQKGVRFTPYTYVQPEQDIVFHGEQIKNFFTNDKSYLWGYYDGTGYEINLMPSQYYEQFIYSASFITAEAVGYNQVLGKGNMLENQFQIYDNPIVVEYYFSGFNPAYAGMDWVSLRLVFEAFAGQWKLVGIIHNQWTV